MELHRLVIDAGTTTHTADFPYPLTVVGAADAAVADFVATETVNALAGARPGVHVEVGALGRALGVVRPPRQPSRVIDEDGCRDVTDRCLGPAGTIDLFAAVGVDATRARRVVRVRGADLRPLRATRRLATRLAGCDQDELWAAARALTAADDALCRWSASELLAEPVRDRSCSGDAVDHDAHERDAHEHDAREHVARERRAAENDAVDEARRRFLDAVCAHGEALDRWRAVAGDVDVDDALAARAEVDAVRSLCRRAPADDVDALSSMAEVVADRVREAVTVPVEGTLPLVVAEPFPELGSDLAMALLVLLADAARWVQVIVVTADPVVREWAANHPDDHVGFRAVRTVRAARPASRRSAPRRSVPVGVASAGTMGGC